MNKASIAVATVCVVLAGVLVLSLKSSRYYSMGDLSRAGLGLHKDAVTLYFTLNGESQCKWARVDRQGKRFNIYLLRDNHRRNDSTENVPVEPFRENENEVKMNVDTTKELPVTISLNNKHVVGTISQLKD